GGVLLKEFTLDGVRVETRLMAYHGRDQWSMLSYRWDADQSDATLIPAGDTPVTADWPAGTWTHPTRAMCRECHGRTPGGSLGLEGAQLAGAAIDPRLGDDQLAGLVDRGLLDAAPAVAPFPALDDANAPLDARARAFLHVNCGYCHQPHRRGRGNIMLHTK